MPVTIRFYHDVIDEAPTARFAQRYTVSGEQVGLMRTDMLAKGVDIPVYVQDWYYGSPGDFVDGFTVTPPGEQYFGIPNDVPGNTSDPAGLSVFVFGPLPGNSPELGLILVTNGEYGSGAHGGATQETEAVLFEGP